MILMASIIRGWIDGEEGFQIVKAKSNITSTSNQVKARTDRMRVKKSKAARLKKKKKKRFAKLITSLQKARILGLSKESIQTSNSFSCYLKDGDGVYFLKSRGPPSKQNNIPVALSEATIGPSNVAATLSLSKFVELLKHRKSARCFRYSDGFSEMSNSEVICYSRLLKCGFKNMVKIKRLGIVNGEIITKENSATDRVLTKDSKLSMGDLFIIQEKINDLGMEFFSSLLTYWKHSYAKTALRVYSVLLQVGIMLPLISLKNIAFTKYGLMFVNFRDVRLLNIHRSQDGRICAIDHDTRLGYSDGEIFEKIYDCYSNLDHLLGNTIRMYGEPDSITKHTLRKFSQLFKRSLSQRDLELFKQSRE